MLVDSHCHLDFPELNKDLDKIIETAKEHDVRLLQTICTKISNFNNIHNIAKKYDNIYCSVGIHPNEVSDSETTTKEELIKLSSNHKVIGLGETGLDYYYEHSPKKLQKENFQIHIEAAQETQLPLIIHTRSADEDTIKILQENFKQKPFPALIHCFTATQQLALDALEMGFYISISGIITFNKAEQLRQIVKKLPIDRLLVETDAPYLAPAPKRGKSNQPAYTQYTAKFLAELKNISYNQLAKITTENFFKLFTKADPKNAA
jgi:TatD DNase family protein